TIGWSHSAGAVGDVRVMPVHAGLSDGWSLSVTGRIVDGPDEEAVAAETVELRHSFTKAGETGHCSLVRVVLRGDGNHHRTNEWESDRGERLEHQPLRIAA